MKIIGDIERYHYSQREKIITRIKEGVPFIIQGAMENWQLRKSRDDAFTEQMLGMQVEYRVSSSDIFPNITSCGQRLDDEKKTAKLSDCLAEMKNNAKVFLDANLVRIYCRRGLPNAELKPLLSGIKTPFFIDKNSLDTIGLWLSGKGVKSRLHYDRNGKNNFNAQVSGAKRFTMISPEEFYKLYPMPMFSEFYNFTKVNNFEPDVDEYPLYSDAGCYRDVLRQGEMLFLPAYWYHSFLHLGEFNFNVNFWSDAAEARLSAVALRNELAAIIHDSAASSGLREVAQQAGWQSFADNLEERFLQWTPQRLTMDELHEKMNSGWGE